MRTWSSARRKSTSRDSHEVDRSCQKVMNHESRQDSRWHSYSPSRSTTCIKDPRPTLATPRRDSFTQVVMMRMASAAMRDARAAIETGRCVGELVNSHLKETQRETWCLHLRYSAYSQSVCYPDTPSRKSDAPDSQLRTDCVYQCATKEGQHDGLHEFECVELLIQRMVSQGLTTRQEVLWRHEYSEGTHKVDADADKGER